MPNHDPIHDLTVEAALDQLDAIQTWAYANGHHMNGYAALTRVRRELAALRERPLVEVRVDEAGFVESVSAAAGGVAVTVREKARAAVDAYLAGTISSGTPLGFVDHGGVQEVLKCAEARDVAEAMNKWKNVGGDRRGWRQRSDGSMAPVYTLVGWVQRDDGWTAVLIGPAGRRRDALLPNGFEVEICGETIAVSKQAFATVSEWCRDAVKCEPGERVKARRVAAWHPRNGVLQLIREEVVTAAEPCYPPALITTTTAGPRPGDDTAEHAPLLLRTELLAAQPRPDRNGDVFTPEAVRANTPPTIPVLGPHGVIGEAEVGPNGKLRMTVDSAKLNPETYRLVMGGGAVPASVGFEVVPEPESPRRTVKRWTGAAGNGDTNDPRNWASEPADPLKGAFTPKDGGGMCDLSQPDSPGNEWPDWARRAAAKKLAAEGSDDGPVFVNLKTGGGDG